MSYYTQYVEPVIGNIKPMLEKETELSNVKKLQKMVADTKNLCLKCVLKSIKHKKFMNCIMNSI